MRATVLAAYLVATALARGAAAQPAPAADLAGPRRVLIERAQQASDAGDHARALDLAEHAGQLRMSASLRRFIAEERAALGDLGAAYGDARECVYAADHEAPSANRDRVRDGCLAIAASLAPRVGRIVVRFAGPAPEGARLRVDGRELARALWGVDYVVTPGTVRVEAEAPGARPFARAIDVGAGEAARVDVALERGPTAPSARPASPPRPATRASSPMGPALAVTGAVLLAGGAAVGLGSDAAYGTFRDECAVALRCDPPMAATRERTIQSLDAVANWTMLVGGISTLVGGAIWLVSSREPRRPTRGARPAMAVAIAPAPRGVVLGAAF